MTIRFKENSIEFETGTKQYVLQETSTGLTFTHTISGTSIDELFQGTVSGYTSGGATPGSSNIIDKFPFATNANATDVGDLATAVGRSAGHSSSTTGYHSGGDGGVPGFDNRIQKFPFATNSNATSPPTLGLSTGGRYIAGMSSFTHGHASGRNSDVNTYSGVIERFPFATDTQATNVGNLSIARVFAVGQSSTVSGYTSGGVTAPLPTRASSNIIDKFPFATNASATDVGDLTVARHGGAGQSSTVSGYTSGSYVTPWPGGTFSTKIDKFPFATDTNATDVGNLSGSGVLGMAGQSSTSHGYRSGGGTDNTIDRFPFASNSSASDVGDLTVGRGQATGQQY